jgi:phytoene dehydrogenase-like protein
VVGAGHDGLVCAAYPAGAGLEVLGVHPATVMPGCSAAYSGQSLRWMTSTKSA